MFISCLIFFKNFLFPLIPSPHWLSYSIMLFRLLIKHSNSCSVVPSIDGFFRILYHSFRDFSFPLFSFHHFLVSFLKILSISHGENNSYYLLQNFHFFESRYSIKHQFNPCIFCQLSTESSLWSIIDWIQIDYLLSAESPGWCTIVMCFFQQVSWAG